MADEPEDVEIELSEDDLKPAGEVVEEPVIEAEPEPTPERPRRGRPPKAKAEAEEAPEPSQKVVEPEDGLEQLKANLAASQAREAAERQGRLEAEQRVAQAQGTVQDSRIGQVESMIAAKNTAMQSYKTKIAEQWANGDFAGASDTQEEMAKSAADLRMLESGLDQLKNQPKPEPRVQQITDPAEALAMQLDPKSAQWVRSHPEYARDNTKYTQLMAAHNLAVAKYEGGSDDYFGEVERLLGIALPGERPIQPAPQRQVAPPAAPVSRGSNGDGSRPTVVRLTADERETAHFNWPDLAPADAEREYAKQKFLIQQANGTMQ